MTQENKPATDLPEEKAHEGDKVVDLGEGGASQLPPPNFATFVFSLSTSALLDLGEMEHPATGKKEKKIHMAKHSIDMLDMISEKTKGNLTSEEEGLLTSVLSDLKMRYVKVST